ncbi:MAG: response regulator [Rubrivivax sp.]|nr:response regulator [Rubrivivax sp.]
MTAKGRILVVDDDRLVLATVAHGLAQAGYEVIDADNGDDAILLARQQRPELALLDIRMEGKTGFDVAEYLRDVAHVPFMFLSAFADADTRAKVEALGAMAYLVKPLDVGQIVPTVDHVFARLRGGAAQPVPPVPPVVPEVPVVPAPPLVPAAVPPAAPADDLVPLALGILMQRFSLTRTQAAERLARLAGDKGLSPAAQAARLVEAVEDLAGPMTEA